jgi:hypothetical protein
MKLTTIHFIKDNKKQTISSFDLRKDKNYFRGAKLNSAELSLNLSSVDDINDLVRFLEILKPSLNWTDKK